MSDSADSASTSTPSPTTIQAHIVTDDEIKALGFDPHGGSNLTQPSVNAPTYYLLDDDAKNCRNIDDDEFKASYVDDNIVKCYLADYSPFEETLDNESLVVQYAGGSSISVAFGLIDLDLKLPADAYLKSGGVIYPIDDTGALRLNGVTTPTLVYTREWVLRQWKNAGDQNVQMADLVDKFVKAGFEPVTSLDANEGGILTPSTQDTDLSGVGSASSSDSSSDSSN